MGRNKSRLPFPPSRLFLELALAEPDRERLAEGKCVGSVPAPASQAGPGWVGQGLRQKPRYEVTRATSAVTTKDTWAGDTAKEMRKEESQR